MHATSDFKKGLKILLDGEPFNIIDFQHHKPGKGNSVTRTKMKHLITGQNIEKTFKSGEKFGVPDVEYSAMKFLYNDDSGFHFMNQESFEQICMNSDIVGDHKNFIIEAVSYTHLTLPTNREV